MVGPFAEWKHARWNLHDVDAVRETRLREDEEAATALGCGLRWLGLPDAIYRGERYQRDEDLFGPLREDEKALADHLTEELTGLPEWRADTVLFVPLGIGSHVDHQILFDVGVRLAKQGYDVFAYEDAPYVIHTPESRDARIAEITELISPPFHKVIEGWMKVRLDAISSYQSQVPVIFRFTDDFRSAIRNHARSVGGGTEAERFWRISG